MEYENTRLGGDCLGEKGIKAEDVGKNAALLLKEQITNNSPLDEFMEDQILPYMALAVSKNKEAKIKVGKLTKHTKTNIWVIEQFLPVEFKISGNEISCRYK